MTSIQDHIVVSYFKPSLQDIITMIPVMDELAADYRTYNRWIEDRNSGKDTKDSTPIEVYINKANKRYEQLCVLKELGFSTSNNNRDIEPPKEIII